MNITDKKFEIVEEQSWKIKVCSSDRPIFVYQQITPNWINKIQEHTATSLVNSNKIIMKYEAKLLFNV